MATRPVVVTTGGTQICAYNPHRTALNVLNNGSETCGLGDGPSLTFASSYPIFAGTSKGFAKLFGDDPRVERWAISQTTNNNFAVYEEWDASVPDVADVTRNPQPAH